MFDHQINLILPSRHSHADKSTSAGAKAEKTLKSDTILQGDKDTSRNSFVDQHFIDLPPNPAQQKEIERLLTKYDIKIDYFPMSNYDADVTLKLTKEDFERNKYGVISIPGYVSVVIFTEKKDYTQHEAEVYEPDPSHAKDENPSICIMEEEEKKYKRTCLSLTRKTYYNQNKPYFTVGGSASLNLNLGFLGDNFDPNTLATRISQVTVDSVEHQANMGSTPVYSSLTQYKSPGVKIGLEALKIGMNISDAFFLGLEGTQAAKIHVVESKEDNARIEKNNPELVVIFPKVLERERRASILLGVHERTHSHDFSNELSDEKYAEFWKLIKRNDPSYFDCIDESNFLGLKGSARKS